MDRSTDKLQGSFFKPLAAKSWDLACARHLLQRAGFGGTLEQTQQLADMGLEAAVESVMDFSTTAELPERLQDPGVDPDVLRPLTAEERREMKQARRNGDRDTLDRFQSNRQSALAEDRGMMVELRQWWLERMVQTPCPLQEKLTLLWHDHFATRHRTVRDTYMMWLQNDFFRQNAAGRFDDLAYGIIQDPAMLRFLNNDRNVARQPNENLARELMELFTLGAGEYTEEDIKQGARALTGYHIQDHDFVLKSRQHDQGRKTILGQSGTHDGKAFVSILLKQKACARFIATKLYEAFVEDLGDLSGGWPGQLTDEQKRRILQLALILEQRDYDIGFVLNVIFKSQGFYHASIVGQKIKSPIHLAVGTVRQTGCPTRSIRTVDAALRLCGQQLFDPPSVAGWSGGRTWLNTSTMFARQNLCVYLLTGKTTRGQWNRESIDFDSAALEKMAVGLDVADVRQVSDRLCDHLIGSHLSVQRRQALVQMLEERHKPVEGDLLVAAMMLVTAMPEYQLC